MIVYKQWPRYCEVNDSFWTEHKAICTSKKSKISDWRESKDFPSYPTYAANPVGSAQNLSITHYTAFKASHPVEKVLKHKLNTGDLRPKQTLSAVSFTAQGNSSLLFYTHKVTGTALSKDKVLYISDHKKNESYYLSAACRVHSWSELGHFSPHRVRW